MLLEIGYNFHHTYATAVTLGAGQSCSYVAEWPLDQPLPYDLTLNSSTPLGFDTFTYANPEASKPDPCVFVTTYSNKYIGVAVS